MLDRTDADMEGIEHTAATACEPPILRNRNRKFIYCEERPERTTGRIIQRLETSCIKILDRELYIEEREKIKRRI